MCGHLFVMPGCVGLLAWQTETHLFFQPVVGLATGCGHKCQEAVLDGWHGRCKLPLQYAVLYLLGLQLVWSVGHSV